MALRRACAEQHGLLTALIRALSLLCACLPSTPDAPRPPPSGALHCVSPAQNNKDYFDQSLDEIKLLKYVNGMDPDDKYAIVRLYDYFYYKASHGGGMATTSWDTP